jgi:hypothetical protein
LGIDVAHPADNIAKTKTSNAISFMCIPFDLKFDINILTILVQ